MATHAAVVTTSVRGPLSVIQVPTISPNPGEVLVKVLWTASTPLDLHQNDGGLLVTHPQVLGDSIAGVVVKVGGEGKLAVGDQVFGFSWREQKEKGEQEFVTVDERLLGKVPENATLQEAVTLPNNLVTVFHALTKDLELPLPWHVPVSPKPIHSETPILIWGGSSSVGQYALQVLSLYGYRNLLATSSPSHTKLLTSFGAKSVFNYRKEGVVSQILNAAGGEVPLVLDCIGSKDGSLKPISQLVKAGAKVAVLLPVIVKDASETEAPEYEMDVQKAASWVEGVDVRGVRTHHYLENEFFTKHLQSEIIPSLLESGKVKPNKFRIVEGETLLERAQSAIDALRRKEVSGERLVWKVAL